LALGCCVVWEKFIHVFDKYDCEGAWVFMMIEEARSDVVCVTVLCCSYVIVMK